MVYWGLRRKSAAQTENDTAPKIGHPWRLINAGGALMVLTAFFMGQAYAYTFEAPWYADRVDERRKEAFYRLAAREIAHFRVQNKHEKAGVLMNPEDVKALYEKGLSSGIASRHGLKIEQKQDGQGFVIFMAPTMGIAFFPYSLFMERPSYRVDETGQVRMLMVHKKHQLCPPDAPVVDRISQEEIRMAEDRIRALAPVPKDSQEWEANSLGGQPN